MKELKPKSQCVLYARKSTEEDDQQIMSIEAQLFELREFAERERIEIVKEFTEAKSAKKPGREVFNEMMTKIENSREPMGIISWHPDRLARNSVDGGKIIYAVDTRKIVSLRFPTFWFEPTPQGLFMLQVAFGQSKYYSDNLVENINRGIRQKLRRGEWLTKAPFGYVNNPKTRTIEPHPVHSRIIVRAYKEYAKGAHSYESLAEFLAEHGIVTKSGTPLGKASVARILTNRAYLGFVLHKGEYHDGSFAPILSPTLFEAVQKVLVRKAKPRKQKARYDFPFVQFMRCGECGGMITAQYSINRWGTKYTYYHCTKKLGKCGQPYIQESALAGQMQALLQTVSLPLEEIDAMEKQVDTWEKESISSRGTVAQNLKTKLSETKEKLDKLVSIYLDGDIEREIYLERKDLLLRQKAKFEESFADFGRQRKNWIEPLRSFVLSLREAAKLQNEQNYFAWRDFFRSIGSNPSLKDKTLSINWGELFEFTAKTKADFGLRIGIFAPQKSRDASVSDQVSLCGTFGLSTRDIQAV
ncbi:MAG: recombinase family protein, partial [bacterium]|nr:recombinase family protein [bacterium]